MTTLTIGMPVINDIAGPWFTVQSLLRHHLDDLQGCEILLADNNPGSKASESFKALIGMAAANRGIEARYIESGEVPGPAGPKNAVFREATREAIICVDSHVLFEPGALGRLRRYYDANLGTVGLYSGPMMAESGEVYATHLDDVWSGGMWGVWGRDVRAREPDNDPFEIWGMGCGLMTCRKDAWLGFNEHFRGFGGEEGYIHEKYRKHGCLVWCLPWLRWHHYFGQPCGPRHPVLMWDRVRNYVIGARELDLPLDRMHRHFVLGQRERHPEGHDADPPTALTLQADWDNLGLDPVGYSAPAIADSQAGQGKQGKQPCVGCEEKRKIMAEIKSIEDLYRLAAETPSDINEHAPKLRELASQCESIIEFGTRAAVSTVALLAGQPKRLVSYDLMRHPIVSALYQHAGGTAFEFRIGDVLKVEPEECDLLFIDTRHTEAQLSGELTRHAPKVRRWIAMHDTEIFGEIGDDGGPGLLVALRKFLQATPEWSVVYHATNNHGLTVISRAPEDKPKLPGKIRMASNFVVALTKHVATGANMTSMEILQKRLERCTVCEQRTADRCAVCGCYIMVKAEWADQECPLGRWAE